MAKSSTTNAIRLLLTVLLLGGVAFGATKKSSRSKPASKSAPIKSGSKTAAKSSKSIVAKPKPAPAPPPLAPGELPLAARSAILLDAKTGDVLYEKNPDELEYPASATKILTAMLIIEGGDLEKMVTVQPEDTRVEPSALYVKPGEQYPRKDLLFALLLKSANDVALALGRDNAGSVEAFAGKMNRRAEELGAVASHFTNPHGLHDPHHFTTARDLACIARAAMQIPLFREIVSTPQAAMAKGDEWVVMKNHNKLLFKLAGCNGVKTGYTRAAQQVLVSSAIRAGCEAISVVLHTNNPGIWEDSKTLLEHGFAKLGVPAATPAPAVPPSPDREPAPTGQGSGSR
jgi:D-alanyl-D-alanine carboxypeptidase (penicillin-binding protein 5/6)